MISNILTVLIILYFLIGILLISIAEYKENMPHNIGSQYRLALWVGLLFTWPIALVIDFVFYIQYTIQENKLKKQYENRANKTKETN